MTNTRFPTSLTGEQIDKALADMAARDSEAYAIGKRDGTDVGSSDPTYHNNAKYYSEQAAAIIASIPSQTGHAGEFLSTDGTNLLWDEVEIVTATEAEITAIKEAF